MIMIIIFILYYSSSGSLRATSWDPALFVSCHHQATSSWSEDVQNLRGAWVPCVIYILYQWTDIQSKQNMGWHPIRYMIMIRSHTWNPRLRTFFLGKYSRLFNTTLCEKQLYNLTIYRFLQNLQRRKLDATYQLTPIRPQPLCRPSFPGRNVAKRIETWLVPMAISGTDWLEVPTMYEAYRAYVRAM